MNIFNTLKDTSHSWNIAIMILLFIYLILYSRFVWMNWKMTFINNLELIIYQAVSRLFSTSFRRT